MVGKSQLAATPSLPFTEDGPLFAEPWQAQAFAMAVRLSAEGHFSWPEWVKYLSAEIAAAKNDPQGDQVGDVLDIYYRQWQAALEKLVADKGLASPDEMAGRKKKWRRAYLNTPHGKPIKLSAADTE
ncbi:MAG: nitrile hydratase accessory protein [Alphaproteobacteria bacterium]|jgi:nitrile hydratase accessory protein|nr:nitrile hydratase accessory protein [Alphaproteobacteria bacterium]